MMITKRWIHRTAALALAAAAVGVVPAVTTPVQAAPVSSLGAGGEFFPITPDRVLDTRVSSLDVAPGGRKAAGTQFDLDVLGVAGVPEDGVLAVGISVTVIQPTWKGFLSLRPSDYTPGESDLTTSLLNFSKGQVVPNFAIVGVGSEGKITLDLSAGSGSADVVVDVFGFVATSDYDNSDAAAGPTVDEGGRMITQTPVRLLDTRPGELDGTDAKDSPMGELERLRVKVRGEANVPDRSSVTGVVLNMAGIRPNMRTYLAVSPEPVPANKTDAFTASGNYGKGEVSSNLVVAPLNDDGTISLFNRSGRINVTLDVVGYIEQSNDDSSVRGRVVPLEAPFRSFDTRIAEFGERKLGFSSWEDWSFGDFAASVTLDGSPVGRQSGLLGNLAGVGLEPNYGGQSVVTYMTLNPTDPSGAAQTKTPPNANLNVPQNQARANMSLVTYGSDGEGDSNMVSAFNNDGKIHYVLDVFAVILDD